jgi:hypothetical protein
MAADVSYHLSRKAKLFVDENYAGANYPKVQLGGGVDPAVTKAQVELAVLVNAVKPISAKYLTEISSVPDPEGPNDVVPVHPLHPAVGVPAGGPGGVPGANGLPGVAAPGRPAGVAAAVTVTNGVGNG